MTGYSWVLLGALVAAGLGDLIAIVQRDRELTKLLRPAFGVLLLALAWVERADSTATGRWVLFAGAVALLADVLILTGRPRRGRIAIFGYAVAHAGYAVAVLTTGLPGSWLLGLFGAIFVAVVLGLLITPIVADSAVVGLPLAFGSAPLVALVGAGLASGRLLVAVGTLLLFLAAAVSGYDRLVAPRQWLLVAAAATQHLGQIVLVIELVA